MTDAPESVSVLLAWPTSLTMDLPVMRYAAMILGQARYPDRQLTGRILHVESLGARRLDDGQVVAEYECSLEVA